MAPVGIGRAADLHPQRRSASVVLPICTHSAVQAGYMDPLENVRASSECRGYAATVMRSLALIMVWLGRALAVGVCAACVGAGGGGTRPGVMPMLSELPGEPVKRDAVLDQSGQTAGPEQRKTLTRKERKAETAAATAAAILGSMFSSTQNVTLGTAGTFDETSLAPGQISPAAPAAPEAAAGSAAPPPPDGALVPWVKLSK